MTTDFAIKTTPNGRKETMTIDHTSFGKSFVTLTFDKCICETVEMPTAEAKDMFARFTA